MRTVRKLLLAGAAAVGIAGLTGLALAASAPTYHEMTVQMPDGGVAHIRYTGKVAPTITFGRAAMPMAFQRAFFAPDPAFVALDRISAAMDRQMAAMMVRADQLQRAAFEGPLYNTTMHGLPAGTSSYFVSSAGGSNFCMKSTEVTLLSNGKSKVVSHTSGNCGGAPAATSQSGSSANTLAHTISAKAFLPQSETRQRI